MPKAYMRIPDLDDEVRDPKFRGWFRVFNYHFGPSGQSIGSHTGTTTGKQPEIKEMTMTRELDALSPVLFGRIASGRSVSEAAIFTEGLEPGSAYAMLVFYNVTFTNGQGGSSGEDVIVESVSISFDKMQYMPQAQYLARRGVAMLKGLAGWFK